MLAEIIGLALVLLLVLALIKRQPESNLLLWRVDFVRGETYESIYVHAEEEKHAFIMASAQRPLTYDYTEIHLVEPKYGILGRTRLLPDIHSFELITDRGPYYVQVLARNQVDARKEAQTLFMKHVPMGQVHRINHVLTRYEGVPIVIYGGYN